MFQRVFRNTLYCYLYAWRITGRDSRQRYCDFQLVELILFGAAVIFELNRPELLWQHLLCKIGLCWSLAAVITSSVRRGHDLDISYGQVLLRQIFQGKRGPLRQLRTQPGSATANRFGPPPADNLPKQVEFPDVWNC